MWKSKIFNNNLLSYIKKYTGGSEMVGKNNQYLKTTKEGTKVESYSIKKFKVGTASVVIRCRSSCASK